MRSNENSEGLFRDVGEVEDFKATLGGKLRNTLRCNYGICHIQALLGEAITEKSSKTEEALILSIKEALDELDNQSGISIEAIRSFVNHALTEVLTGNFGEFEASAELSAEEMKNFGLFLSRSADSSRGHRRLSAGEELPF